MDRKNLKGIRKCDECATKKTCFVYYPGKHAIDCIAWVKERKTETRKKSAFLSAK